MTTSLSHRRPTRLKPCGSDLVDVARQEVARVLDSLPEALRLLAGDFLVSYASCPDQAMLDEGVPPETLGLFAGSQYADEAGDFPQPQIILFLEIIAEIVQGDAGQFRHEVGVTFIHELGHYLGFDEEELSVRE